jgi:hypothetical protein
MSFVVWLCRRNRRVGYRAGFLADFTIRRIGHEDRSIELTTSIATAYHFSDRAEVMDALSVALEESIIEWYVLPVSLNPIAAAEPGFESSSESE